MTDHEFISAINDYKSRLFHLCQSFSPSHDDAKELFQDSVFRLWKSKHTFSGKSSAQTWMYRIVLNNCLKYSEKRKSERRLFNSNDMVTLSSIHIDDEPLPAEQLNHLRECIAQLELVDRTIITLYLDEIKYKDIADILGISENHVAVKLKRIRTKLLECMETKT